MSLSSSMTFLWKEINAYAYSTPGSPFRTSGLYMRNPPYQQCQQNEQRGLEVAVEVGGHELQVVLEVAAGLAQGQLYRDDGQGSDEAVPGVYFQQSIDYEHYCD